MQDGFKIAETLLVKTKKLSGRPVLFSKAESETAKKPEAVLGQFVCLLYTDDRKCFHIPGT
jgi:hypothetical protein